MRSRLAYLNKCGQERRIKFFKRISLNGFKEAFIRRPQLASLMISDLLAVGNYTEDDIYFGSNIPVDTIHLVAKGSLVTLALHQQFDLMDFYFRVFMKKKNFIESNEPCIAKKRGGYDNSYRACCTNLGSSEKSDNRG